MAQYHLSVLDLSPVSAGSTSAQALANTIDLAQLADQLGYTRYWLVEHHNTRLIASSVPEVMNGLPRLLSALEPLKSWSPP